MFAPTFGELKSAQLSLKSLANDEESGCNLFLAQIGETRSIGC